jgi:SET domain-containing protein
MSHATAHLPNEILFSEEEHLVAKPVTGPRGAEIGWGLFARRALAPGETVIRLDWSDEERSEILSWDDTEEEHHNRCAAIAPRWYLYVGKQHPFWYLNHSCTPNVAFKNWAQPEAEMIPVVALRVIAPGEQLALDYSLTITGDDGLTEEDPWTMECLCGEASCRGMLTCFIRLPHALQW